MDLPEAAPNETRSAPDLLVDLIAESEAPVELVAVGPLTNVALAVQTDPTVTDGLAGITIMGGAIDVPGNVFRNDVGEWNIWVDPTAAAQVLAAGAPVTLIPLDATNHLPTGRIFWESLDAVASTPAATLVRDVWADSGLWIDNAGGFFFFWDELAAAVLVDESLVTFETRNLVVDDQTRDDKGWTRETPEGTAVRVAVAADRRAFEQRYLDTLAGGPTPLGYLDPSQTELAYFSTLEQIEAATADRIDAIFEQAAATVEARGGSLDSESGFFLVVAEALGEVYAGPWADRVVALAETDVPGTLTDLHKGYVAALIAFRDAEQEFRTALEGGDFDRFGELFAPVAEACQALQQAADERLVPLTLDCG
jgi:hypothetical protein